MRLAPTPSDREDIQIGLHQGRRLALWPLFELADDSPVAIRRYLDLGLVHVALIAGVPIGHAQIVPHDTRVWELKSLAVLPAYRGGAWEAGWCAGSMAWVREHRGGAAVIGAWGSSSSTSASRPRLVFPRPHLAAGQAGPAISLGTTDRGLSCP